MIEPPKERDEVTSDNILGLLRDNGVVGSKDECDSDVVGSKDECDSDVLPELKDDGIEYPVNDEALIARPALQAQIKTDTFNHFAISLLQELEDVLSEWVSSRLTSIRDITYHIGLAHGDVLPKQPTYRSNPNETNELQIHQFKANKSCIFIVELGDWFWKHVKDLYPFDAGSDSMSNRFEEGGDDAIQASHGPLLHWTQAKDHIGGISEANRILEDQNKRETKFGGQKRRKSREITMRSHGYRRMR
ncbi:Uncharacterized protein Adt_18821 [Abeliophyllum distichum]|uniref:Uncharacterized protein n=1 Tax=Abeliophyllum distichum TaxID=126358 RepID=A0ABD1TKF7_9LAMI